jgi:transcriptional regulator with XRE-family HTH domain
MTQDELAKQIQLPRTAVANIEAGRQRVLVHTLDLLAVALKSSPNELVGFNKKPKAKTGTSALKLDNVQGNVLVEDDALKTIRNIVSGAQRS